MPNLHTPNPFKFCFIICTNNKQYETQCLRYLHALKIPNGYTTEILTVYDASSMTSGYNEAMVASDAKYKIYLHHDVYIINNFFLFNILDVFQESSIGMIGMVGCPTLPKTAIMWNTERSGCIYSNSLLRMEQTNFNLALNPYQTVAAIDGLLMITQYDIPWREDLFKHWDFYDVSQSFEFRKAGYQVVVPHMDTPWCIHDDHMLDLNQYYKEREIFIKEYASML